VEDKRVDFQTSILQVDCKTKTTLLISNTAITHSTKASGKRTTISTSIILRLDSLAGFKIALIRQAGT
jgi:hypothetical protein